MIDALYSREILRRTTQLLHQGRLEHPQGVAEKVAKLCGSKVRIELCVTNAVVSDFAIDIKACALGQAAGAILSQHIVGAHVADVVAARDALKWLLEGEKPAFPERFSDLKILESVKDFPARHASTLLALEATVEAIEAAQNRDKKSK